MSQNDEPLFLEPDPMRRLTNPFPMAAHRAPDSATSVVQGDKCSASDCWEISGYNDLPFCQSCAWKMWVVMDESDEYLKEAARRGKIEQQLTKDAERMLHDPHIFKIREMREYAKREPGWIYYLLVGDLIKIGFTADIDQRMRSYPPNIKVLAIHAGTKRTERQMHHQFLFHLDRGREWFRVAADLLDHIEHVRTLQIPKHIKQKFADLNVIHELRSAMTVVP